MTDLRKAAEQALEAFEVLDRRGGLGLDVHKYIRTKIEALRQALAQPEQETMPDDLIASYEKGFRDGERAEREKVARWMRGQSYATGHGDTTEDLLKHLDWQARDYAHKLEREACAKVCDELAAQDKLSNYYAVAARAIREKGNHD